MKDNESNRFADPVLWVVVLFFGLLFYLFAYPVVMLVLVATLNGSSIETLDTIWPVINVTIAPLEWLVDTVPFYDAYIDFLGDRLLRLR